jgi:AbrB family looped-hinge helix DNA binding protein
MQAAASLAGLAMVALLDGHGRVSYSIGMRVARATVSHKGQVVIPKALRDRLGIRPGQELEFSAERGKLVVRKVTAQDPVDRAYGVLQLERGVDETLRELRGEPDAVGHGD